MLTLRSTFYCSIVRYLFTISSTYFDSSPFIDSIQPLFSCIHPKIVNSTVNSICMIVFCKCRALCRFSQRCLILVIRTEISEQIVCWTPLWSSFRLLTAWLSSCGLYSVTPGDAGTVPFPCFRRTTIYMLMSALWVLWNSLCSLRWMAFSGTDKWAFLSACGRQRLAPQVTGLTLVQDAWEIWVLCIRACDSQACFTYCICSYLISPLPDFVLDRQKRIIDHVFLWLSGRAMC